MRRRVATRHRLTQQQRHCRGCGAPPPGRFPHGCRSAQLLRGHACALARTRALTRRARARTLARLAARHTFAATRALARARARTFARSAARHNFAAGPRSRARARARSRVRLAHLRDDCSDVRLRARADDDGGAEREHLVHRRAADPLRRARHEAERALEKERAEKRGRQMRGRERPPTQISNPKPYNGWPFRACSHVSEICGALTMQVRRAADVVSERKNDCATHGLVERTRFGGVDAQSRKK